MAFWPWVKEFSSESKGPLAAPFTHPASGGMREWGIFQLR